MYHDKIIQLTTHKEKLVALTQDGKIYVFTDKWIKLPLPIKAKFRTNPKQCKECSATLPNHEPWHLEALRKK